MAVRSLGGCIHHSAYNNPSIHFALINAMMEVSDWLGKRLCRCYVSRQRYDLVPMETCRLNRHFPYVLF